MKRDDARAARPFDPTASVPALLNTLNNRLSSGASDLYLRHFGVGINEWRILTVLRSTSGCTAAYIAAVALARERCLLQGLSDAEVDTLRGLLGRLTANVAAVDAYVPEGGAASS